MKDDIKKFIKQCEMCQQVKYLTGKKQGVLQPLPIPTKPWQDLTMDFITGLPISSGHTVVMVVVDRFSKQANFVALQPSCTASIVAEKLVHSVIRLHGFPCTIITDRVPIFLSKHYKKKRDLVAIYFSFY